MLLVSKIIMAIGFILTLNTSKGVSTPKVDLGISSEAGVLMEAESGKIIYSKNEHKLLYPASMTKMVGLVIVLDYIQTGKLALDEMITVSNEAASMGGTQVFLQPGETMSVNDLLKAVAINSANDAIYALGEAISGSEENFIRKMNEVAKDLGMLDSNFVNTTGFDDPNHLTSAYDMALVAQKLVSYGDLILQYTSKYDDYIRTDTDNPFWLVNTNKLVRTYNGMDGLKTGFTQDAGFCLAATAKRNNLRLIAVTMKADTKNTRSKDITTMLNYGFANYEAKRIFASGQILTEYEFKKAANGKVGLAANKDVFIMIPKGGDTSDLNISYNLFDVSAPLIKNQVVGMATITDKEGTTLMFELSTVADVEMLTWWKIVLKTFQDLLL